VVGDSFAIITATSTATEKQDQRFIKASARRGAYAALFVAITLAVLLLAYIPIVWVHQSWEDEVYWASTCLSMLRHNGPTPSILADYPSPQSPLYFYGPTLFWLGTLVLKIFGFSMRTWRSFAFAGNVAFLAAVRVLFYRLRRSWAVTMATALVFSLTIGSSFGFSLPGRPDAWTLALITLAIALVVSAGEEPFNRYAGRWTGSACCSVLRGDEDAQDLASSTADGTAVTSGHFPQQVGQQCADDAHCGRQRGMRVLHYSASAADIDLGVYCDRSRREQGRRCGCISPHGGQLGLRSFRDTGCLLWRLACDPGDGLSPALAQA
jgi:hypothetical protein